MTLRNVLFLMLDQLRWDYQRLRLIAATGWERPAKEDGTCWRVGDGDRHGGDAWPRRGSRDAARSQSWRRAVNRDRR